jgi:dihydrofolate reductase
MTRGLEPTLVAIEDGHETGQPTNAAATPITTFTFVTGGVHEALARAREAAGDASISIAGGASTLNQFLAAGLVDELRLHVAPVTLGVGVRVFDGVPPLRLKQVSSRAASLVTHVTYRKAG